MSNNPLFRFVEDGKSADVMLNSDGKCAKLVPTLSKYRNKWHTVTVNRPIRAEQALYFNIESSQVGVCLSSHDPALKLPGGVHKCATIQLPPAKYPQHVAIGYYEYRWTPHPLLAIRPYESCIILRYSVNNPITKVYKEIKHPLDGKPFPDALWVSISLENSGKGITIQDKTLYSLCSEMISGICDNGIDTLPIPEAAKARMITGNHNR